MLNVPLSRILQHVQHAHDEYNICIVHMLIRARRSFHLVAMHVPRGADAGAAGACVRLCRRLQEDPQGHVCDDQAQGAPR